MPRFDHLDKYSAEELQKKLDDLNQDYEFVMKKIENGQLKGQEAVDLQNDINFAREKIRYIENLLNPKDETKEKNISLK